MHRRWFFSAQRPQFCSGKAVPIVSFQLNCTAVSLHICHFCTNVRLLVWLIRWTLLLRKSQMPEKMTDKQESPHAEDATPSGSTTFPLLRPPCERLSCHKSSVCSRSYFVVVMVFFHVYIINVIALLFYVHYSSGQGDANRGRDAPGSNHRHQSGTTPSKPEFVRDISLTRIEGIRVSNVIMHQSHFKCIPSVFLSTRHHQITSLVHPFRWDMSRRCHLSQAGCMKCGRWVWNHCCLVRTKTPTHPHKRFLWLKGFLFFLFFFFFFFLMPIFVTFTNTISLFLLSCSSEWFCPNTHTAYIQFVC